MKKKKILISISDGMVERNMLKTDFLKLLINAKDLKVFFVSSDNNFYEYLKKEYLNYPIEILYEPYKISKTDAIFNLIFLNSINTETVKEIQYDQLKGLYGRTQINFCVYVFFRMLSFLSKFKIWRIFLRILVKLNNSGYGKMTLREVSPDLVFVPSINITDYKLVQEAKNEKIKVIQMIKSWDNLTSKTFLRVIPDYLIVYNEVMKEEAIKLDDMPQNRIFISGIPQFDYLVKNKEKLLIERNEFYDKIKISPDKNIILFCSSGDSVSPNDEDFLIMINNAIEAGEIKNAHVQVRSHPKFINNWKTIKNLNHVTLERPFSYLDADEKNWVFSEKDMVHWFNSIYHSSMVINVASSMSIDASILDRPVICLGFDGYNKDILFEESILRYYSRNHYKKLLDTNGVNLVKSEQELIGTINLYLNNRNEKSKERRMLVQQQCYKLDGNSSARIVSFLESKLN